MKIETWTVIGLYTAVLMSWAFAGTWLYRKMDLAREKQWENERRQWEDITSSLRDESFRELSGLQAQVVKFEKLVRSVITEQGYMLACFEQWLGSGVKGSRTCLVASDILEIAPGRNVTMEFMPQFDFQLEDLVLWGAERHINVVDLIVCNESYMLEGEMKNGMHWSRFRDLLNRRKLKLPISCVGNEIRLVLGNNSEEKAMVKGALFGVRDLEIKEIGE